MTTTKIVLLARTPNADMAFIQETDGVVHLINMNTNAYVASSLAKMVKAVAAMDFVRIDAYYDDLCDVITRLDEDAENYRLWRERT